MYELKMKNNKLFINVKCNEIDIEYTTLYSENLKWRIFRTPK